LHTSLPRLKIFDAQRKGDGRKTGEEKFVPVPGKGVNRLFSCLTARSSGGGGRKKLSAYNKFMQTEMARLKEDEPDMAHQDR